MMASKELQERWEAVIRRNLARRGLQPATDAQMAASEEAAREEWRQEKARILLSRLDARYRDAVPRHDKSWRWLFDYRAGDRRSYVILGDGGAGKTWEACALAKELLMIDGVPVLVITEPEMYQALRPNRDGASDIGQFQAAPVLVIDDLGSGRQTDWTAEQLFRVADYRNVRKLPVIITSNLSGRQIRERYDSRTVDRLVEGAMLLDMPARNFRVTPL
jgi:DNA replication protein DnaC